MSYAERRRRKNSQAKTPAQIRQALAKSEGRHIHPWEDGYWHEYPRKFHRESCGRLDSPPAQGVESGT